MNKVSGDVMSAREEREGKITRQIVALWANREKEWLTYKEVVNELVKRGLSERTAIRYLITLVRERKLDREERGYKKTFYRPNQDFLRTLYPSLDWIRSQEELLERSVRETVSEKFEKALFDSRETDKRIEKLISEEIDKIPREPPSDEEVAQAIDNVLSREKMSEADSNMLAISVERFLKAFYDSLSDPYNCAGLVEPHILISDLAQNVTNLLSGYMDLWSFIYRVPRASFEFKKYMEEKLSFLSEQ
jgi:hypothetical protein